MISASALRMQWSQLFAPADRTLPAMLTRQAERFAQRPLVTAHDTTWTYADACEAAARFAGTMQFAGIQHGDRVAIICSNRIEFFEVVLGCAWLGAIAVPINVASRGPQLQHILSNCGARLLVMEAAYAENLTMLNPRELAIETIWLIGATADVRIGDIGSASLPRGGERIAAAPVQPGDLSLILYTSGTTGPSKGVCCPQAQYFWWAVNTASLLQLRTDDVLCTSLPLVSYQCAQHLLSGPFDRLVRLLREEIFRVRILFFARPSSGDRHLSARRHGADPALAAGFAGGDLRIRCGSLSRPVSRRSFTRNSRNAPGSACSTAGARRKPILCWARPSSTRSLD